MATERRRISSTKAVPILSFLVTASSAIAALLINYRGHTNYREYYFSSPSPYFNYREYHFSSTSASITANAVNSVITSTFTVAVPSPSAIADSTTLLTEEHRFDSFPYHKLRPRLPSSTPTTLTLSSYLR